MTTTITLDQAKDKVKAECKTWTQEQLVTALHEMIELVPGLKLEQWMSQHLVDSDGNSPTIIGHG